MLPENRPFDELSREKLLEIQQIQAEYMSDMIKTIQYEN